MSTFITSGSLLQGLQVENTLGENLGQVKEVIMQWKDNYVDYGVLLIGGLKGFDEQLIAIPFEALSPTSITDGSIKLDVRKEQLLRAPRFTKGHYPAENDPAFMDQVYIQYGYKRYSSNYTII